MSCTRRYKTEYNKKNIKSITQNVDLTNNVHRIQKIHQTVMQNAII